MQLQDAYIVSAVRTPVGKANRGSLRNVHPVDLGAVAVKGAMDSVPGLDGSMVDDLIMGCAFPEGPQGTNMARAIAQRAGLPDEAPGVTVNRFCSSGLQNYSTGIQLRSARPGRLHHRRWHGVQEPGADGWLLLCGLVRRWLQRIRTFTSRWASRRENVSGSVQCESRRPGCVCTDFASKGA